MKIIKYLILFVLILGVLISSISYAFYINEKQYNVGLEIDDYLVDVELSFNGIDMDPTSIYYDLEKEAYQINLFDYTQDNYIAFIDLIIHVNVPVASRMRFKINESYELTRYYHNAESTIIKEIIYMSEQDEYHHPFSLLKTGTYQNYFEHTDRYSYINEMLSHQQSYLFHLIDAGSSYTVKQNSLYYETCYLYLSFDIELVQANRFSQVWDVDPLLFG